MVDGSNANDEAQPARKSKVQRRFTPDQSLKPKLLDEGANLLEVKDFIIEFTNYIRSGYNPGEVAEVESIVFRGELDCLGQEVLDEETVDFIEREIVWIVSIPPHVVPHSIIEVIKILLGDDMVPVDIKNMVEEVDKLVLLES